MARQKYSEDESLNRILRTFKGSPEPSDIPETLSPIVEPTNIALSDLAELIDGSLPGEAFAFASSMASSTTKKGVIETATNAEVVTGTDTERATTPAGVAAAIAAGAGGAVEFGEIYNNSTGTAVVALSTSWGKITGSFQGDTLSSSNIVPDYTNDKITINHVGTFFVGMQLSFSGSANAVVEGAVYLDGNRTESIRFRRKLGATGDVGSASAIGVVSVTGTAMDLEIYARVDSGTPNFKVEAGQLWLYALPSG